MSFNSLNGLNRSTWLRKSYYLAGLLKWQECFLLTIDSIRADRFSGPKKTAVTPNFDFIIENGLFFEQNISSCDQTGTSLASIFTGKYPMNSGVTQFNFNFEFSTFFDHLKNLGYSLYSCVSDLSIFEKITENFDRNSRFIYGGTTTYPHLYNDIGDGKFYVPIRSGLIKNNYLLLFTGSGIVSESDSHKEWEETSLKLEHILSYFKG